MSLQDKYADLILAVKATNTKKLQIKEQNNLLYIEGEVPTGEIKDNLWSVYNRINPRFLADDLVLNICVAMNTHSMQLKVVTTNIHLSIRKGPDTVLPILGKAARNATVVLLSKYNDTWFLIRNEQGIEGYSFAEYLQVV